MTSVTDVTLSRLEDRIQRGIQHQQDMLESWLKFVDNAVATREEGDWRQMAGSWDEFCKIAWGVSASRIRQFEAAAPAGAKIIELADYIPTESEIRRVRSEARRAGLDHNNPAVIAQICTLTRRSIELTGCNTGAALKTALNVFEDVRATGGFVDDGDGGMTALDAALVQEQEERMKRQRQHIRDKLGESEKIAGRIRRRDDGSYEFIPASGFDAEEIEGVFYVNRK